jgi:lysophospholipase L1-like esterase
MPDKTYGWVLRPNYHKGNIRINALGFRGDMFSIEKPKDVYRILVLGDSITFGGDVSYVEYLQQILNQRQENGKKYEVINGGVIGYATSHVLKRLKEFGIKLHPDLIILYCGWNDLFSYYPGDPAYRHRDDSLFNRILHYSYVMKLGAKIMFQRVRPILDSLHKKGLALYKLYAEYEPVQTRDNLKAMAQFITAHDLEAIIVTWPSLLGAEDLNKYKERLVYPSFTSDIELLKILWKKYNQIIIDVAEPSKKVYLFDLNAEFMAMDDGGRYFLDTQHPNFRGHRIIAELLYEYMVKNNLLGENKKR